MRFVRLISETELSESRGGEGQIKLRRRKAISGRKTKGTRGHDGAERETLLLNESGLSSDHYTRRTTRVALS